MVATRFSEAERLARWVSRMLVVVTSRVEVVGDRVRGVEVEWSQVAQDKDDMLMLT
jgi:hypothetical protein